MALFCQDSILDESLGAVLFHGERTSQEAPTVV